MKAFEARIIKQIKFGRPFASGYLVSRFWSLFSFRSNWVVALFVSFGMFQTSVQASEIPTKASASIKECLINDRLLLNIQACYPIAQQICQESETKEVCHYEAARLLRTDFLQNFDDFLQTRRRANNEVDIQEQLVRLQVQQTQELSEMECRHMSERRKIQAPQENLDSICEAYAAIRLAQDILLIMGPDEVGRRFRGE